MTTLEQEPTTLGSEVDAKSLQRLVRAVRDLAAARDVPAIVEVVRHAARELVDADGATFVLRDGPNCYYVDEDAIEPLWRGMRFPLEACISGWAMQNKQAVYLPDIYVDDRIPAEAYRPTFVKSLAMTPVRKTGDPVAAIGTYWAENHETTPAEAEVLQALADSVAVALEHAQTLERLEEEVAERTAELATSNADLSSFAQVVAHDLKAPLTSVALYADLLQMIDGSTLSPEGADALVKIDEVVLRMGALIDAVLTYSTATASDGDMAVVDLGEVVARVRSDIDALVADKGATVEISELPTAFGSSELLARVLQNLIVNAIQYGDPDHPVVRVEGATGRTSITVSVSDNGQGVPEAERSRIFDMLTRGSAANRGAGSGIGLAFARRVAVGHGGSLSVDDAPGGGARFTLTLPIPERSSDLAALVDREAR